MRIMVGVLLAGTLVLGTTLQAQEAGSNTPAAEDHTIYAPPSLSRMEEAGDPRGPNVDFAIRYLTDYVYRGINYGHSAMATEGKLTFDLGRWTHPFIGVFGNFCDSDPVSRVQEIRPFVGADISVDPLLVSVGQTTCIYPERQELNTGEIWARLQLDSFLSPYLLAAYDYDVNEGLYLEAGVRYDFPIEYTGLTLSARADLAYISGIRQQFTFVNTTNTGFQHYDVGLTATYSLNTLLNIPRQTGQFNLEAYLYYTGALDDDIRATNTLWGGVGMTFHY